MWFLIRSGFWLGLVFSTMDWSTSAPDAPVAPAASLPQASDVAPVLTKLCADHARACLKAAKAGADMAAAVNGAQARANPKP